MEPYVIATDDSHLRPRVRENLIGVVFFSLCRILICFSVLVINIITKSNFGGMVYFIL